MTASSRPIHLLLLFLTTLLLVAGCTDSSQGPFSAALGARPMVVAPATHSELKEVFNAYNYHWDTLKKGVPPLILESLPEDLNKVAEISKKKHLFFLSLLPMVLMLNDQIRHQRQTLLEAFRKRANKKPLNSAERTQVVALARKYHVKGNPLQNPAARKTLLRRVDTIPPSIVLAQAANESAYGTSRFALRANNIFGEWTFVPGTGLVPRQRPDGRSYEVRRFPSVYASVQSYMLNINTHWAYRGLREKRARLRAEGRPLRGDELVDELKLYSTRREAYVENIRTIIRDNRLSLLAKVSLRHWPSLAQLAPLPATFPDKTTAD